MTPAEVTAAVSELAADQSPGANANVDATTSTCPAVKLEMGIFFDGTFNDARDSARNRTNVNRLQSIYKSTPDTEFADCGGPARRFLNPYIPGVGPDDSFESSREAGFSGLGPQGILNRMERATDALRDFVTPNGGFDEIESLTVDIFGFSRGAATAAAHQHPDGRMGGNPAVPDDLRALAGLLAAGVSPDAQMSRTARAGYAHRAWEGVATNRVELDFVREVYPNRP